MKKVIDWPSFGPKRNIRSEWSCFVSLDEPRFHWLLDTTRGHCGYSTPTTHKYVAPDHYEGSEDGESGNIIASSKRRPGVTVARSGLISRRGYVRIIREDISAIERDVMISELKALAKKVLTGRSLTLFERRVIGPLEDPHSPRPSVEDLAAEFKISPQRVYKIISKAWRKIEKAHRAAQAKEDAPIMLTTFTAKRQTGGISYQSNGLYWDETQLARSSNYSTSINSAATAASTRDIKNND
jgi:hypothetical protein